jgi:hypothetical protein
MASSSLLNFCAGLPRREAYNTIKKVARSDARDEGQCMVSHMIYNRAGEEGKKVRLSWGSQAGV